MNFFNLNNRLWDFNESFDDFFNFSSISEHIIKTNPNNIDFDKLIENEQTKKFVTIDRVEEGDLIKVTKTFDNGEVIYIQTSFEEKKKSLSELKQELQQAVNDENYELAATLQKQIKSLKSDN